MKPPLTYYGGKQQLASYILALFPKHTLYCEPFIGGAALFFAKPPNAVEVINDTNRELINFYRVVQQYLVSIEQEIRISLNSRDSRDSFFYCDSPHPETNQGIMTATQQKTLSNF